VRFAICSEVWKTPIEETIRRAAEIGFDGLEIAPFTVAPDIQEVTQARRREIRTFARDEGIQVVGLHWLLVSPAGFHLTTADGAVRERTARFLAALVHFCADLGGSLLVLGSPKQRSLKAGTTAAEALARAAECLQEAAREASERRVRILIEPLAPAETDFLNTVEDALRLARLVDHPQVGYHLDVKAMASMPEGIEGTLRRWGAGAGHFHANGPDGLGPGMGKQDFQPIFQALLGSGYLGWASAEPFDYGPDPDTVARAALRTMREAAG
jgi:sugar phosphate isomerase/epimerase